MAPPTRQAMAQALQESLSGIVAQQGADLEDVEVSSAGRRTRIRLVVDADDGIDLDAIASISHAVSSALDDPGGTGVDIDSIVSGAYTLEVTSPGVDRPLTLPRHWRRNVSRLVEITLVDGDDMRQVPDATIVGRITAVSDADVTVDVDGHPRDIPLAEIARATVRIEFRRPDEGR